MGESPAALRRGCPCCTPSDSIQTEDASRSTPAGVAPKSGLSRDSSRGRELKADLPKPFQIVPSTSLFTAFGYPGSANERLQADGARVIL